MWPFVSMIVPENKIGISYGMYINTKNLIN